MDNDHGPVAHSDQVPSYSTQLSTSKLGIMIALSLINLRAIMKFSHATINQKDFISVVQIHHLDTVTNFSTVCRTSNIYFASCHSMYTCSPLLLEASTHVLWIQTILSWPKLSNIIHNWWIIFQKIDSWYLTTPAGYLSHMISSIPLNFIHPISFCRLLMRAKIPTCFPQHILFCHLVKFFTYSLIPFSTVLHLGSSTILFSTNISTVAGSIKS